MLVSGTCKYCLFHLSVAFSNNSLHGNMIHHLVRSPSSYFDVTSTGRLNSILSNDLGLLDTLFSFFLNESVEGAIVILIIYINAFTINLYFLIPGLLNLVFLVLWLHYFKLPIIIIKQLDLKLKSPVFEQVGETLTALVQIRIYERRFKLIKDFGQKLNESLKANLCFWNLSRAFAINTNTFSVLMMCIGCIIGIAVVKEETSGLYACTVVLFVSVNDFLQWFLRQVKNYPKM